MCFISVSAPFSANQKSGMYPALFPDTLSAFPTAATRYNAPMESSIHFGNRLPRPALWMVAVVGVVLGLGAVVGWAEDGVGLPTNVCRDCGARQQHIWTRFEQGEGVDLTGLPRVYAGVCHVFGDHIDPDREHHVGFLFDSDSDDSERHELRLRFSFFTAAQPYDKLDATQARAHFGTPALPLAAYRGYAYTEIVDHRFFARYWFRRARNPERVLLVSYFGDLVTVLCEAAENRD